MTTSAREATDPTDKVDWSKLGFVERECNGYVSVTYKDGQWGKPEWNKGMNINVSIASPALNYGQQCFEGIKVSKIIDEIILRWKEREKQERRRESS